MIDNTLNLDTNNAYYFSRTYPSFQEDLAEFKEKVLNQVHAGDSATYFKFGDGDFNFLKGIPLGSAAPGNRALSRKLKEEELDLFRNQAVQSDFYMCEIMKINREKFREVFPTKKIEFPAEFVYGLLANKWLLRTFAGQIGLIGASEKLNLIKLLLEHQEYREYLGLSTFGDYISIPQKFACDDLPARISEVGNQIKNSKSKIFLVGVGHLKSGLLPSLPLQHKAVYLDVGSGIDALAGIIDRRRPYFGDWTNFRLSSGFDYSTLDLLQYEKSKVYLL